MTVGELIKRLGPFCETHIIEIEVDAECGHLKVRCPIDDVQFKNGNCILYGQTD